MKKQVMPRTNQNSKHNHAAGAETRENERSIKGRSNTTPEEFEKEDRFIFIIMPTVYANP